MRTDENNNPAAFTVDVARQAGLIEGKDFVPGEQFHDGSQLHTAKLLGDPVQITIRVIDAVGYYTKAGKPRWDYIAIPDFVWAGLDPTQKRDVIGFHYHREGGTALQKLFPRFAGKVTT